MKAHDARGVSTLRMVLAQLKDRDIAARPKGNAEGIGEAEIQQMLQGMVKQRRESITLYQQGNRPELVKQEQEEIAVISAYLPKQMSDIEAGNAIAQLVHEINAQTVKDMGRVMAALKERYAGKMDFSKVSAKVKDLLSKK